MSFQFTLQKILEVRENDKLKAEKEFSQATRQFEEVATKLYELLKKKENHENDYYQRIESKIHVFEIQQSHSLLAQLQKQIDQLQYYTQKARDNMNRKQEQLVEKSIELKKYEKMKQIKYEFYVEETKRQENILMDEISVQQFINR
ncbi:flagellar export protein FliJ [Anaerobacillus isosaccharinicus]|uniref:Flagellar FliJ protein n=1 Tax=Anaerobacillus isosaccharinicus TaxID=1532552 RepID=A0A1S2L6Y9_9BACI|nr:flagellar export protein FliJ [Anaerobacillus isosaccharinicus]MBA5587336.1 flagellar biosynthesis chaperone FliJ [Anaerobacillus isosaccharinicus]QOY34470.1 flagellar biosynthesis chaperone FliJ [Anaerobacillus isosaccharinicus]